MIIIIEGPDGSGKTTLAKQISKQTGYQIVHWSMPKTEEENQNMLRMYEDAIAKASNIILDRCWYSEMAYGPVMREGSAISYPDMYRLERQIAKKGAMIIYCSDAKSLLWKRCISRGEDYVTCKDDFFSICDNYEDIMACPHIIPVVNYTVPV